MPTTPQQAAGSRMEPPVSEPMAPSKKPAATPAAEPLEKPPRRRALVVGYEVVGRERAARGGQPAEVTEVLEGERDAVERPAPAPGSGVGLERSRGLERALFVEADESVEATVPLSDAPEAALDNLDRRDPPCPDVLGEADQSLVTHPAACPPRSRGRR